MRVDYECRLDYSISRYPPGGARVTLDVNFHNVKVQDWMRFGDFADGYPPPLPYILDQGIIQNTGGVLPICHGPEIPTGGFQGNIAPSSFKLSKRRLPKDYKSSQKQKDYPEIATEHLPNGLDCLPSLVRILSMWNLHLSLH